MSPVTLEVMTMLPPSGRCGTPCLMTWKAPRTWTASTRANSSLGYSTTGATAPLMPALLKRTSRRPCRSTPASIARLTASSSVTSATALEALSEPRSSTALRSLASAMPTRCTRAPSATNSRAVASPIPLSPPVISTTLSWSRAMARDATGSAPQRRARGRVRRRRQRVDAAARVDVGRALVGAAERLVEQRARVGEAVDPGRADRALVRPARERVAERPADAAVAAARIAEAGAVPPEAAGEERRADERLPGQADDLEGDLAGAAVAEVVEAQLARVDAGAPAAAVADREREVLAPQLEVLDRPAGRGSAHVVEVTGPPLRHAGEAPGRLRPRRGERLRVDDRVRRVRRPVVARPRDPPAPDRRVLVVVLRVVGVVDRSLAGPAVEREDEQVAAGRHAGRVRAPAVDQLGPAGGVGADVGVGRAPARGDR